VSAARIVSTSAASATNTHAEVEVANAVFAGVGAAMRTDANVGVRPATAEDAAAGDEAAALRVRPSHERVTLALTYASPVRTVIWLVAPSAIGMRRVVAVGEGGSTKWSSTTSPRRSVYGSGAEAVLVNVAIAPPRTQSTGPMVAAGLAAAALGTPTIDATATIVRAMRMRRPTMGRRSALDSGREGAIAHHQCDTPIPSCHALMSRRTC